MADNRTLPLTGTGDATAAIRTVEKTALHTQSVLVDVGGSGAESFLVRGQMTAANSLPVVLASDQGSHPVTVSGTVTVDSELTTADLDIGAGTDTRAVVGLVLAASGGGLLVGAANPLPVSDNAGSLTVDGTVTANAGTGPWPVTDNGGSLTVDGTVSVSGTVTVDSELPAAAALADNTANPTVPAVGAFLMAFDGTNWDRVQTGAASGGALKVDGSAVTQPVSIAASVTVAQATASNLNAQVVGSVASGSADSGNPVKVGGRATQTEITAVTSGNRVDFMADINGKQVTLPYAVPERFVAGKTADITGTTDTAVIAAQGVGLRIYVTQITITNSHATVGTWVNIKDGTSALYTVFAAAAGGGATITLPVPLRLTANTALNAANETTGSNTRISASGYVAP